MEGLNDAERRVREDVIKRTMGSMYAGKSFEG